MTEITSDTNVLKLSDWRSFESGLQSFRWKDTSFFKTKKNMQYTLSLHNIYHLKTLPFQGSLFLFRGITLLLFSGLESDNVYYFAFKMTYSCSYNYNSN